MRFLGYLRAATGAPGLAYAEPPSPISGGFDAQIFGFRLDGAPPHLMGPLVLRLLRRAASAESVVREAAVQNALVAMGFPAAPVPLIETDSAVLGGAFLVMRRLEGVMLGRAFESLGEGRSAIELVRLALDAPFGLRRMALQWLAALRALHGVPPGRFATSLAAAGQAPEAFRAQSQLNFAEGLAAATGLEGLKPGFEWLQRHHPTSDEQVVCHGDLHPLNIMVDGDRLTGVLDWGAVCIGPRELDLGAVAALVATVPIGGPPALKPLMRLVMRWQGRTVVEGYRRLAALDPERLRYFEVYCCLRQLLWVGVAAARGAPAGIYASRDGVQALSRRVYALCGVRVEIPMFRD